MYNVYEKEKLVSQNKKQNIPNNDLKSRDLLICDGFVSGCVFILIL